MSAHTSGPWSVDAMGNVWSKDSKVCEMSAMPIQDRIYVMKTWEQHKADARLIAAAPDLLVALQSLIAEYEPNLKAFALNAPRKAKWGAARAAIAKATGSAA